MPSTSLPSASRPVLHRARLPSPVGLITSVANVILPEDMIRLDHLAGRLSMIFVALQDVVRGGSCPDCPARVSRAEGERQVNRA